MDPATPLVRCKKIIRPAPETHETRLSAHNSRTKIGEEKRNRAFDRAFLRDFGLGPLASSHSLTH